MGVGWGAETIFIVVSKEVGRIFIIALLQGMHPSKSLTCSLGCSGVHSPALIRSLLKALTSMLARKTLCTVCHHKCRPHSSCFFLMAAANPLYHNVNTLSLELMFDFLPLAHYPCALLPLWSGNRSGLVYYFHGISSISSTCRQTSLFLPPNPLFTLYPPPHGHTTTPSRQHAEPRAVAAAAARLRPRQGHPQPHLLKQDLMECGGGGARVAGTRRDMRD